MAGELILIGGGDYRKEKNHGGLKGLVAGLIIGVAATGIGLKGCSEEYEKPVEARVVQKEKQEDPRSPRSLMDYLDVKISDGKTIRLEHQRNGVYRGRQNRLVGSEIVEIKYDFNRKKTYAKVKEEGSLFSPEKEYFAIIDGYAKKGDYAIESKKSGEINFKIDSEPFKERSVNDLDLSRINIFTGAFEYADSAIVRGVWKEWMKQIGETQEKIRVEEKRLRPGCHRIR